MITGHCFDSYSKWKRCFKAIPKNHRYFRADVQSLGGHFGFFLFCPLAQVGSQGEMCGLVCPLPTQSPRRTLERVLLVDARGGRIGNRQRGGSCGGSSLGPCGGSSWHPQVTFQNASMVPRSQTSQGQV